MLLRELEHWVIVLGWLEIGGAERQALKFACGLKERGHAVTIVGVSTPGRVLGECAKLGIDCFYWPTDLSKGRRETYRSIYNFWRRISRLRPTYLAPYTMLPNVLCGLVWRFTSARSCIWQQRDEGRLRQGRSLERVACRWTPGFISNSEHGRSWLIDSLGVDPQRTVIVRNGVSMPAARSISDFRKRLNLGPEALVVTMVANLHRFKDHFTLLRAWRILKSSIYNIDTHLILAGRFDDTADDLRHFVHAEGLSKTVHFIGSCDDVQGLLWDTQIFVFSSKYEGCSNAVLEAMATGLPVVATDIPANREALGEMNRTFLTPVDNAKAMADALSNLAKDRGLRTRVGRANRLRIEQLFSESEMIESTVNAFVRHSTGPVAKLFGRY